MRAPRPCLGPCGRPRLRALRGVAARAGPGPAGRPPRPGVAGRKRLVLSLDGGGLKALLTLGVLEVLEEVLGEVGADHGCADLKLAEAFDLMAGTSAGAIAATLFAMEGAGLAGGGVPFDGTAGRAAAIVKQEAKRIFPFSPLRRGPFQLFRAKYPSRGVEGTLQAVLGDANTWPALAAAPTPFRTASLLVCSYDLVYQRPIAFVADRDVGEANLLRLDPLAAPFNRGSWRLEELERRLRAAGTWPFWGTDRMSLFNLGGAAAVGDHTVTSGATPTAFGPVRKEVWTMTRRFKLWQGVRCASAANTYFPPALVEGFYERVPGAPGDRIAPAVEDLVTCDAGIVANNPAPVAVNYLALRDVYGRAQRLAAERTAAVNGRLSGAEALRLERDVGALAAQELDPAGFAVLSIGTGAVSKTAGPETWKTVASPLDWISGKFGKVASVLDLIMDASPEIAAANLTDLFRASGVPDQYLRVQVAAQATPGETPDRAGYAPAEVLSLLAALDDTREGSMDELHRIGREVGEVYRPLLERWVRSNVFDEAAGAGVSPASGSATAAASS